MLQRLPRALRLDRLIAVIFVLAIAAGAGGMAAPPSDAELSSKVDAIVAEWLKRPAAVGVSVGVARGGKVIVAKGYGLADVELDVPAGKDTMFRIGSVTKQFTAAAIMRFVEQGRLSLDDGISKFITDFPMQGNSVTIRHLLNHTSTCAPSATSSSDTTMNLCLACEAPRSRNTCVSDPSDFAPGTRPVPPPDSSPAARRVDELSMAAPMDVRHRLHTIIFESDTPAGRAFDIALIIAILASTAVVMLESVESIRAAHAPVLRGLEWTFTILFTIEYVLRLISVRHPLRYMRSFYGVIDLLAILPTYVAVLVPGTQALMVIRLLRLVRVFRIFKLTQHVGESKVLVNALRAARPKITVFLLFVVTVVFFIGALMYVVEGPASGFVNIPESMYWAIVTLTTVGYGDILPQTPVGKLLACVIMVLGYGVLAVPTGIVTTELAAAGRRITRQACPACSREGHDPDARHCKYCGADLAASPSDPVR